MRSTVLANDSFPFWKKIIFIAVFFIVTPVALATSVLSLFTLDKTSELMTSPPRPNLIETSMSGVQVYASLPSGIRSISGQVSGADARVETVRQFLENHNSPLTPLANFIVQAADKYELDFRLISAIAMKESGVCKVIPEDSFNCWGWGIHSKGVLTFDSFEEGIDVVSKGLKEYYIDNGYETVEEIMTKYAHPSSTTWAEGVSFYMLQMQ